MYALIGKLDKVRRNCLAFRKGSEEAVGYFLLNANISPVLVKFENEPKIFQK